jgi:cytochrome P450
VGAGGAGASGAGAGGAGMGGAGARATGAHAVPRLPDGPREGRLAQTVGFHRDPLGFLRAQRARHGDLFTIRLTVAGPAVVVADPAAVPALLDADPLRARTGEARRLILGFVSPHSVLGADGGEHQEARARVAPVFAQAAVDGRRASIAALAEQHATSWPRGRPTRLLPRTRAFADEVFVRLVLGVRDERRVAPLVAAIRRMLWTPGYPPLPPPGEGAGLVGQLGARLYDRRAEPVRALLCAELAERAGEGAVAPGAAGAVAPHAAAAGAVAGEGAAAPTTLLDAFAGMPVDTAVDQLIPLLAAGQEPPACALAWLLDRIAREPAQAAPFLDPAADADPRAAAERERFVKETLRLRPPVHAVVRRLREPLDVAGFTLPARTTVMLPTVLLHRDPAAFPDPDRFLPARWRDGPDERAYLPFGGGARRCVGEPLAHALLDVALPRLARAARLRPVGRAPDRMVVRGTVTAGRRSVPARATGG